jgi:hypothetical protein
MPIKAPVASSEFESSRGSTARTKIIRLGLQMLREEVQAAGPSDIGACLVVAGPLVAMEAVLCTGIGEDLDFWLLSLDCLDVG